MVNLDRASGSCASAKATCKARRDGRHRHYWRYRDISDSGDTGNIIRLSPKVHEDTSDHDAIPSIPANIIGPFLSQPLVIEEDELQGAPVMIGAREGRVVLGKHDIGFAKGRLRTKVKSGNLSSGQKFVDPETEEVLGIEAVYLATPK